MEKVNSALVKELADELNFTLSEQEVQEISEEFNVLMEQIALLNEVDTQDVEPMVYPFEVPTAYYREDVVSHTLPVEKALENVPTKKDGYVIVPKVIK